MFERRRGPPASAAVASFEGQGGMFEGGSPWMFERQQFEIFEGFEGPRRVRERSVLEVNGAAGGSTMRKDAPADFETSALATCWRNPNGKERPLGDTWVAPLVFNQRK